MTKKLVLKAILVVAILSLITSAIGFLWVLRNAMALVIPVEVEIVEDVEYELGESTFEIKNGIAVIDTPCETETIYSFDSEGVLEGVEIVCEYEKYRIYTDERGDWSIYYVLWD